MQPIYIATSNTRHRYILPSKAIKEVHKNTMVTNKNPKPKTPSKEIFLLPHIHFIPDF